MFEFMKSILEYSKKHPNGANAFFPVSKSDIAEAETRLKVPFPNDLKVFFDEIGCGFFKAGGAELSHTKFNYLNRFLDPGEIVDVYLGEDEEMAPSEGFAPDELPFFEVADRLYLVLRSAGKNPYAVCWPYGDEIADNIQSFVRRLVDDPRFYHLKTKKE